MALQWQSVNSRADVAAAAAAGDGWLLLAGPSLHWEPGMQQALLALAETAAPREAVLAARVLPDGFAWPMDPVTMEAERLSMEGVLLRAEAVRQMGGFDARLRDPQTADLDLCARLRAAGWRLRCCPQITAACTAAPYHGAQDLPAYARQVTDACVLAAKYRRPGGIRELWRTLRSPRHYPGVRRALLRAVPGCLLRAAAAALKPTGTEERENLQRLQALPARGLCPLEPADRAALLEERPLVSVIIRTCGRPDTLRETLKCLRHQTWRHFEVVVVEDGAATAKEMLEREFRDLPLRYRATGTHVGRGRAGNLGIELAHGMYVSFLDDDDFYYPDHIELHLAALCSGRRPGFVLSGTAAQAGRVQSRSPYRWQAQSLTMILFDHITLMDMCVHCRVPISGGMLKRQLLLRAGGMREDLGGDEDWAMWLRCWALDGRRETVPELPRALSLCRYPADPEEAAARETAYAAYDEQMLADPDLVFACTEAEIEGWRRTVAGDIAHLRAHDSQALAALLRQAAAREGAAIEPAPDAGPRTLTAAQIRSCYWYLVRQEAGES